MYQEDRIWDEDLFQITSPQNQEENPDPHKPKVLFLSTPGKQESSGQDTTRNLKQLKKSPESPDNQGMLTHIKKLVTYVSNISANFLGFVCDEEVSDLVLSKIPERIRI